MPFWLETICTVNSLSTPILILAVIAYLPNLYFNSNSKIFRSSMSSTLKGKDTPKNQPIAFSTLGVRINILITILAIAGIGLTFFGC